MAFKFFVGVLLIFTVGNYLFFLKNPTKYHFSLPAIRKGLYSFYVSAITVGLLTSEVELSNWPFLLTLTTAIVFIDLTILLTPSIMKLWNAEFKYGEYIENVIRTNDKIQKGTMRRVGTMSEMIQNAGNHFGSLPTPISISSSQMHTVTRKERLQDYLKLYGDQYGFLVQLWELKTEPYDMNRISRKEGNMVSKGKPTNKIFPKKTTRFVGETKMSIENQKALKIIRAFKGMFG